MEWHVEEGYFILQLDEIAVIIRSRAWSRGLLNTLDLLMLMIGVWVGQGFEFETFSKFYAHF